MREVETAQNACPKQKIVNEGVDRNHAAADLDPKRHALRRTKQETRQGHREDLVGDAVGLAQRLYNGGSHPPYSLSPRRLICCLQLPVEPADQIAIRNIANEQEQRVRGLVEAAVPQVMAWQRTIVNVIGLGAGPANLIVPAAMEMPIALHLWTTSA